MANPFELQSFLSKFCNLWSSGRNARLAVECQAGQATVNLQLDLGLPHHAHPQEHHKKQVSPSRLRRRARRAQARIEAAVVAAQATAAEEEADKPSNTNTAAAKAAQSVKDAPEQDAASTLTETKDAAVQAGPQVTEAAAQAAGHTVDVAVQAEVPQHLHQPPPPLQQAAAQALHLASPAVQDLFCPDREFWKASRAEQERDGRDRDRKQKEDRRKDLEDLQKMLDRSVNFNI